MYIYEFSSLVWCTCARTPYSKQNIFSYLVFVCCAYTYTFSDVHVCVCMFVCASVLIVYVCDIHHLFLSLNVTLWLIDVCVCGVACSRVGDLFRRVTSVGISEYMYMYTFVPYIYVYIYCGYIHTYLYYTLSIDICKCYDDQMYMHIYTYIYADAWRLWAQQNSQSFFLELFKSW